MTSFQDHFAIGFDIGATKIASVLLSESGELVRSSQVATLAEEGPQAVLDKVADQILDLAQATTRQRAVLDHQSARRRHDSITHAPHDERRGEPSQREQHDECRSPIIRHDSHRRTHGGRDRWRYHRLRYRTGRTLNGIGS